MAFVPEDRTTEAIIGGLSVAHNVALGLGGPPWFRRGRMDWDGINRQTCDLAARYGIRGAHPAAPAASLSGGNQQKLVVARALACRPAVVVAENPTRGLDVQAAAAVWAALRAEAGRGAAVLVWSSDLDDVVTQATRLVAVARGELRDVPRGSGHDAIGRMMLGPAGSSAKP